MPVHTWDCIHGHGASTRWLGVGGEIYVLFTDY